MANLLARTKISTKIIALLLLLGAVVLAVAVLGARSLDDVSGQYSVLVNSKSPVTTKMARVNRTATQMVYAGYRAMVYPGSSAEGKAARAAEQKSFETAKKLIDEIKQVDPDSADAASMLAEEITLIHTGASEAIRLGLADQKDAARAILVDLDTKLEDISTRLAKANDARIEEGQTLSNELSAVASSTSTMMLVVSVVGIIMGVGVALFVSRIGITAPLARLQESMGVLAAGKNDVEIPGAERGDEVGTMAKAVLVFREQAIAKEKADAAKTIADGEQKHVVDTLTSGLHSLSKGDLTADINSEFAPEYAAVKSNFNEAIASLRGLIGSVTESAASIRTGSHEIAQASEDLARRTESNAASLEETSAAITQIDGRLKASAVSAKQTVERADGAIATVAGGRGIAEEAVQAMGRVSESAKGIDSVIEGLDKIAFQTRVLAMNAAVEAGRAGEAGRGFAVVADLVGALAMRSEEEAKRAREQLTATQTDVVMAVQSVQKVDLALTDISGDVGQVHELLATMAADNQAQSSAITQVAAAVATMDQSTQQNAAMVEETSAAARNLSTEVAALSEQASTFNVGNDGKGSARTASKAAKSVSNFGSKTPAYLSPVKPLPAAAIPALVRSTDDWKQF